MSAPYLESRQIAAVTMFRATVTPTDRLELDGHTVRESVDQMLRRLEARWPGVLTRHGVQPVGEDLGVRPHHVFVLPHRIMRVAWVTSAAVPERIARGIDPHTHRHIVYDLAPL